MRLQIGHRPGSRRSTFGWTGQVQDAAFVTRTSGRPQILHGPALSTEMSEWTEHVQTRARRTWTSVMWQIGQAPALPSTTSACIGQVQESGGSGRASDFAPAPLARAAR